jgi:retinol dehydrogenase 12
LRPQKTWQNEVAFNFDQEIDSILNFFNVYLSKKIYKKDAHVILACRSESKGREAVEKIINETKNEKVYFELLDLASLTSVRDFADRIKAKCKRLDILINNAGQFIF